MWGRRKKKRRFMPSALCFSHVYCDLSDDVHLVGSLWRLV